MFLFLSLVSILLTACKINEQEIKNFGAPINYSHFIFISLLPRRSLRCDNSPMMWTLSRDDSSTSSIPPTPHPRPAPHHPLLSCCISCRFVNEGSDSCDDGRLHRDAWRKMLVGIGLRLKRRNEINNNIFPGQTAAHTHYTHPPLNLPLHLKKLLHIHF